MSVSKAVGKHILVVQAEHKTRHQHVQYLQQQGHTVTALASGRELMNCLRAEAPPDLMVIDPTTPHLQVKEFRQTQLLDPRLARVPVLVVGGPELPSDFPGPVGFVPRQANSAELARAVEQRARARRPSILAVEDQAELLLMLEKALVYFGFIPRLASGGQAAVEVYRQESAAVDLVLLEVQMVPLDGPQTLAALQHIDPDVRAVFMSGSTGSYTTEDLLARGAAHIFAKPLDLAGLTEYLWELFERPNGVARPT
jgi:two-component system, OmpR family, response regulator